MNIGEGLRCGMSLSHPLHETIDDALLAGAVELDRQLVAVDGRDVAVAEFLVKDAVAEREGGDSTGRLRHQLALDGERQATRAATPLPNPSPRGGRGHGILAVTRFGLHIVVDVA